MKASRLSFKAIITLLLFFILGIGTADAYYRGPQSSKPSEPESFGLIIKFRPGRAPSDIVQKDGRIATANRALNAVNNKYSVGNFAPLDAGVRKAAANNPLAGVYIIQTPQKSSMLEMKADYEKLDDVLWAEPDYKVMFYGTPTDEYYSHLWGLYNHGQGHYAIERGPLNGDDKLVIRYGLDGADIGQTEVPALPSDETHRAVVAIIDTGVDMQHPDLEGQIWTNVREVPDNGKDDDHNGYIDDVHGWDYSASNSSPKPEDNDPSDNYGHGTHIAGTIAAVAGNEIGIAGIASQCRIMPLKINPWALTSKIARAIIYATDNGADVINMSFGIPYRSLIIETAMEYADSKGVVMCASSGNDGAEKVNYPAGSPLTMAIGATNDSDRVTVFSSYGDYIDLCAPGEAILSLRAEGTDMYDDPSRPEPGVHIIDSLYYISSGTSMSCPHVVAAAAWLKSKSPGLLPGVVRDILNSTAKDIVDPYGQGDDLAGFDIYSGHGRLDLAAAESVTPDIVAKVTSPAAHQILNGDFEITGSAYGSGFSGYHLSFGPGYAPEQWTEISTSSNPVTDDVLAVWHTDGLDAGIYTLKMTVGQDNETFVVVHVISDNICTIKSPKDGEIVPQIIDIRGSVYGPEFDRAVLEYGAGAEPTQWTKLTDVMTPTYDDILTSWYIKIDGGNVFSLRLTLFTVSGVELSDTITVTVESILSTEDAWKAHLPGLPSAIASYGDYNGDGVNEIIVGTDAGIVFLSPDGTMKSSEMPSFPENTYQVPVAVGDANGDGIDDIAALGYDPPTLYFFSSAGPTFDYSVPDTLVSGNVLISEGIISKVFFKDIDGDGADEVHLFLYNGSNSHVYIFDADGNVLGNISKASDYLSCDLNGDKFDEFYIYRNGSGYLYRVAADGQVLDSVAFIENGVKMNCRGLSAFDIDGDGIHEMIINGAYDGGGNVICALKYGFQVVTGWPHDMELDDYLTPTVPIFADIDGDDVPEYFTSYFDYSESFIFAWHIDGTPIMTEGTDGHFIKVPHPALLNMPLVADIDGDLSPDIIARANNDLFSSFTAQRLYAWNNQARPIDRFPIVLNEKDFVTSRYTPTIGDINKDGFVDLIVPTDDSALVFINFSGSEYNADKCPVPSWRYSRRLNNVGPINATGPITGVDDGDIDVPTEFNLAQNMPNPFNPSTTINYTIVGKAHVRLDIYNMLGRRVRTLADEIQTAGPHSVVFDGCSDTGNMLASGIYLYRLSAGDKNAVKKMILLK